MIRIRLVLAVASLVGAAAADEPELEAVLSCRPEAAPGRVLCELKYVVPTGRRLAWADAVVTSAPDFARPLRSRLSPERFGQAAATERKLSLAFVASKAGVGRVTVQARAVVCRGQGAGERCRPHVQQLAAELRVGS